MNTAERDLRRFLPGLIAILVVALLARGWAHPQMSEAADTFAPIIDSEAYLLQALRVADGGDISEGVYFQAPLYPWLLGLTLWATGVPGVTGAERVEEVPTETVRRALESGRSLNLILGLIAVLLIARVAQVLYGDGAALAAGLLAAAYAPFVFYEGLLLKANLSLVFLPWAVLAGARALRLGSPRALVWAGIALGLGGLVRGNLHVVAWLGAAGVLVFGFPIRGSTVRWRAAGALVLGVALAVSPVVVRNSVVAGRAVLSTAAGGTAFYLCNRAENDTGIIQHTDLNRQVPAHEAEDWRALAESRSGRALAPSEVSSYWFGQALSEIGADPGHWLFTELRKLALLFSRHEAPDNTMPSFAEDEVDWLRVSPSRYATLLPLALGGMLLAWRRRRREPPSAGRTLLALALAGYAASLLLFIVTSRFRLPLAPLVIVYAGYLVSRLGVLARSGPPADRWAAGGAVLAGMVLGVGSEWGPLGPLDERELASHTIVCLKNRAQVAQARGDWDAARLDLDRAVAEAARVNQASASLHVQLARLANQQRYDALGARPPDAVRAEELLAQMQAELQHALAIDPEDGGAWRELGLQHYEAGRDESAVQALTRCLTELPRDRTVHQYLVLSLLNLGRAAEAEPSARLLTEQQPEHDDGWGLLALVLFALERTDEAREALERYDALGTMREGEGQPRRLADQPAFAALRSGS